MMTGSGRWILKMSYVRHSNDANCSRCHRRCVCVLLQDPAVCPLSQVRCDIYYIDPKPPITAGVCVFSHVVCVVSTLSYRNDHRGRFHQVEHGCGGKVECTGRLDLSPTKRQGGRGDQACISHTKSVLDPQRWQMIRGILYFLP